MVFNRSKPIRLIELFAGIGSQAKALSNLGLPFEHWRVCEFNEDAVKSYNAVHHTNFSPSDITKLRASDLGIYDTAHYNYLLTYSFPCQDLSNAGKGKGMEKGSGTRSGLLWEVERLLNECKELPQILLMENVPQVHGEKNKAHFDKWLEFLNSKGYTNFWKDLNSKDYGIPQNRKRCIMVSVLGLQAYTFPAAIPLLKTMGDLLDDEVPEHYYLTEKKMYKIANWKSQQNPLERVNGHNSISPTLTARGAGEYHSGMVLVSPHLDRTENLRGSILQREVCSKAVDLTKPFEMIDYTYSNARLKEMQGGGLKVKNKTDTSISCTLTTHLDNFAVRLPGDMFRVITPLESWRLMGFDDEDFHRAARVCDDKQLYQQAGNSIVVNVLMAVLAELFLPEEAHSQWLIDLLNKEGE